MRFQKSWEIQQLLENFWLCPAAPIRQPRFFSLFNPSLTYELCLQTFKRGIQKIGCTGEESLDCIQCKALWMAENHQEQISILNKKLSEFAPSMPHAVGSDVIKQA
ncbi:hypothetical protein FHD45_04405 [Escherichia coli]|nr:hypothetical protein [Escherichia coli]